MADITRCTAGDWVEVERVLLEPVDRSTNLPEDTAAQPLMVWVKGFALTDAALGDELSLETMTGRTVSGRLSAINPGYFHTFGRPAPELTHVGRDLRARVAAYRASAPAKAGE
ncbi:MAG: 2-amino-4-oxopentanoate thiolase subunit OrtA [Actinomycetota bacterium]|nr:MAG: hypothetical protein FD171_1972 [Actinomycetota bacterium]MDO8950429.1 2-amino-4-oxopentanoate thiolase subunit OrtA [Actinomycetota bacterium]MDP3630172.1 2-amino-4-oxopentanoate thiolase subunit OrtA [Actinomycetota bacterium]